MTVRPDRLDNESIGLRELDEEDSSYRVLRFRFTRLSELFSGLLGADEMADDDPEEQLIKAAVENRSVPSGPGDR